MISEGPDLFRLVVADGSTEAVEPFESLLFWWADPNSVRVGTEMLASQSLCTDLLQEEVSQTASTGIT